MHKNRPVVGIDGNEANLSNRVGVNSYAYEVLAYIALLSDEWVDSLDFVVYLKNEPLAHMPLSTKNFKYKVFHGSGMWILRTLTPHLFKNPDKLSAFWAPSHYLPPLTTIPCVCSVMDLGYLENSEQFTKYDFWQLKLWTAWSIKKAKKIIAISEATRRDIVKRYPSAREKTVTTLLGYDCTIFNAKVSASDKKRVSDKYSIGDNYVLFMGTLKPSKNVEGLLQAWSLIQTMFPKTNLVVSGKKGWLFENIFEMTKRYSLENRVVFTDFVDEGDKPALIAGAKLFVIPSFWEGFGLDVLSAMACGVPVVASNRGSLPEVVGEAGIIVDPENPEDIAKGISKVLSANKREYAEFAKRGLTQAKKFSWEKTARETIKILLDAASN